jgi:hypothetical protein
MENGVSFGRFVDKRLIAVDDQGALSIETGAFGAVVADVYDEVPLEFMLNIEIPDLDVAEGVIGIDGEVVGTVPCRAVGKPLPRVRGAPAVRLEMLATLVAVLAKGGWKAKF